jgi:DNA polymerase-3 subunit gamma/tau
MAYEVIARKWRPQTFADVVGQDHVVKTLQNAIESERLAHAYLFVGPRGIGKTSIVRIFAKSLNCSQGPTLTPCGTCDVCKEIAAGTSLDVLEIDGASNNGVDQVRELRDTVKFAPNRSQYKIFIIDEVHMLSTPAFNALLKTLEEPPAHVKFFFATTEPQKILPTVISRCQRFDLRRIPAPQIVERLALIADSEDVKVEDKALLAIARGAEGGLRDAESALDQLISFCGNEIAEEDVLSVFGLVSLAALETLAEAVLKGDIPSVILQIASLDDAGKDFQRLVVELMEHFRNILVCQHVDAKNAVADLTESQSEVLRRHSEMTDSARALRIIDVLSDVDDRMRFALSKRTLMETALIRAARAATVVSLEEILARVQALRSGAAGQDGAEAKKKELSPEAAVVPPQEPVTEAAPVVTEPPVEKASADDFPADLVLLRRQWPQLIEQLARKAVLARGVLADAKPVAVEQDQVVVGFDREFPEEMARFEHGRDRRALEMTLGNALGRKVKAAFLLIEGGFDADEVVAEEAAPIEEEAGPARNSDAPKSTREWAKETAVRKALDAFEGSIVEVRE